MEDLQTSVLLRYTVFLCVITSLSTIGAVENGGVINIDLSSLNASTHEVTKIHEIIDGSAQIHLENVSMIGYFIIQVHSFEAPVYLVRSNVSEEQRGVNGTNIGLVEIWTSNEYDYTIETDGFSNVAVLIVVIGYDIKAPIPGGCSLTFDGEDAPYQRIVYSESMIEVMAQAPRLQDFPCSSARIDIDVYHLYLDQGNYSSGEYFLGIERMLTPESIRIYGKKMENVHNLPDIKRYFSLYQGVGAVYAIVTNYHGFTSAYVPAVSYGCFGNNIKTCMGLTTFSNIINGFLFFYGFILCMTGHRLSQDNFFNIGFLLVAVTSFVIILNTNISEAGVWPIMGITFGLCCLIIWGLFKPPKQSVMLYYFVAGVLIAGIFFYFGQADAIIFRDSIIYWSIVIGIILVMQFLLLLITHWHGLYTAGAILTTSFIGAYILVVPSDFYTGGGLRYLYVNIVRRATVPNFNLAIIDSDKWCVGAVWWCFFTVFGIFCQWRKYEEGSPNPPPRTIRIRNSPSENSPLLAKVHP